MNALQCYVIRTCMSSNGIASSAVAGSVTELSWCDIRNVTPAGHTTGLHISNVGRAEMWTGVRCTIFVGGGEQPHFAFRVLKQ
jgi:hypothetical protein